MYKKVKSINIVLQRNIGGGLCPTRYTVRLGGGEVLVLWMLWRLASEEGLGRCCLSASWVVPVASVLHG